MEHNYVHYYVEQYFIQELVEIDQNYLFHLFMCAVNNHVTLCYIRILALLYSGHDCHPPSQPAPLL